MMSDTQRDVIDIHTISRLLYYNIIVTVLQFRKSCDILYSLEAIRTRPSGCNIQTVMIMILIMSLSWYPTVFSVTTLLEVGL